MAGNPFSVSTPTGGVALAIGTAKTILTFSTPANQMAKVRHVSVFFKGVLPTDPPIQVLVMEQTKGSGTTGGSVTPTQLGNVNQAIQCTAAYGYSVEPTYGSVLWGEFIQPQLGGGISLPISQEWLIPGGGMVGIVCTVPGASTNANTAFGNFLAEE